MTSTGDLLARLGLDAKAVNADLSPDFPARLPQALLGRIRPGDPADPILRQVLPTRAERANVPGYTDDPVGEQGQNTGALLQKYAGRALLVVTQACDVHCRYCFRRSFDYASARSVRRFADEFEQIRADPTLHELILSGGDPLTLSNARLQGLIDQAESIPHLQTLRLHTRSAIVRPARIDQPLVAMLGATRLKVVLVTHANCAAEIDASVATALNRLRPSCTAMLNQAVLLAGVNDTVDALGELSHRLLAVGVLPYYLHALDPVAGAAHFFVPDDAAANLVAALRDRLPGYLVPKFVREQAGARSKSPVA